MKYEECGADGGLIRPVCTKLKCPNLNLIDIVAPVPLPLPIPSVKIEEVVVNPGDLLDFF